MSANNEYEEKASLGAATISENLGELPNPPSLYRLIPEPRVDHTYYVPTGEDSWVLNPN